VRSRLSLLAVSSVLVAACADQPVSAPTEEVPAPVLARASDQLADRYIVVFRPGTSSPDRVTDELIRAYGGQVHFRYGTALQGFAATLSAQAVEGIRRNPNVSFIEPDGIASVIGSQTLLSGTTQWGLDRIDQRDLPFNNSYTYQNDGSGVYAYIIDTGVLLTHSEYNGRASSGYDFIDNDSNASDCHGHGTHVAGTVAGTTVGVAKNASIVAVRVLNCSGSGTWSQVIAGIDWVAANHQSPAVANMSLGGSKSLSVNTAVENAVAAGVTFAVAAGNSGANACNYSPASAVSALTVGATTSSDARASFSNYGSCLDIFAPGSSIYSSVMSGGYASWSGTSMASPHVAGVAALYLASSPSASPSDVASVLTSQATPDKVTGAGTGSPNRLLYNQVAGSVPVPPPPPPPPPPGTTLVHVHDLSGNSFFQGKKNWKAQVTALVTDESGVAVGGATVSGSFTVGGSGSCTTGSNGRCTITSGSISGTRTSTTFSVSGVSGTGMTYDSGNAANQTSETVSKP
jgi:subtilisin family serine protease